MAAVGSRRATALKHDVFDVTMNSMVTVLFFFNSLYLDASSFIPLPRHAARCVRVHTAAFGRTRL